ncbi:MAG: hypothetical protein U0797_12850 [Gemmataceae bacterium]
MTATKTKARQRVEETPPAPEVPADQPPAPAPEWRLTSAEIKQIAPYTGDIPDHEAGRAAGDGRPRFRSVTTGPGTTVLALVVERDGLPGEGGALAQAELVREVEAAWEGHPANAGWRLALAKATRAVEEVRQSRAEAARIEQEIADLLAGEDRPGLSREVAGKRNEAHHTRWAAAEGVDEVLEAARKARDLAAVELGTLTRLTAVRLFGRATQEYQAAYNALLAGGGVGSLDRLAAAMAAWDYYRSIGQIHTGATAHLIGPEVPPSPAERPAPQTTSLVIRTKMVRQTTPTVPPSKPPAVPPFYVHRRDGPDGSSRLQGEPPPDAGIPPAPVARPQPMGPVDQGDEVAQAKAAAARRQEQALRKAKDQASGLSS